jgi:hypothetical protein
MAELLEPPGDGVPDAHRPRLGESVGLPVLGLGLLHLGQVLGELLALVLELLQLRFRFGWRLAGLHVAVRLVQHLVNMLQVRFVQPDMLLDQMVAMCHGGSLCRCSAARRECAASGWIPV